MDVRTRPFATHEAHRLDELRVAARGDLAEAHLVVGRIDDAVGALGELTRDRPLDEHASALYMRALFAAGRQADALAAYARTRSALDEELGIDPGPELEEVQRLVLNQDPSLRVALPDPIESTFRMAALPAPVSGIIGREQELTSLSGLLEQERLVTITGPGGVGKTRLAIEAAGRAGGSFPHGVAFVDLSAVRDPSLVPSVIADTLRLDIDIGRPVDDAVSEGLADRSLLLVLDNMEQVADAAPFIARMLSQAPRLRILITSRVPLWIRGEREFAVDPLPPPTAGEVDTGSLAGNAAVTLFMNHVGRHSDLTLTSDNASTVAEICRRLDGLPLALEVVAARARTMGLPDLLERLEHRLDLPATDVDMPARQRTLRDAIGWSVDLLSPSAADLFPRLGAFVGGFPLDGATAVGGRDVDDALEELVRHSIVRRVDSGAATRYGMLDMIREYAADELAAGKEEVVVRERLVAWLTSLLEAADAAFTRGRDEQTTLARAIAERANVRDSLTWAAANGRGDAALRLAAWRHFWMDRGSTIEGRGWIETLLSQRADYPDPLLAQARMTLASFALYMGDFDVARREWEDARPIWERLGERRKIAVIENNLGIVAERQDDLESARDHTERALAILRELDDKPGIAAALGGLGVLAARDGDIEAAERGYREAMEIANELGDERTLSITKTNLGDCAIRRHDLVEARRLTREALDLCRRLDDFEGTIICLESFAKIAAEESRHDRQVTLFGGSHRLRDESGAARYPFEVVEVAASLDHARVLMGDAAYEAAWQAGQALSIDELVDLGRDDEGPVSSRGLPAARSAGTATSRTS